MYRQPDTSLRQDRICGLPRWRCLRRAFRRREARRIKAGRDYARLETLDSAACFVHGYQAFQAGKPQQEANKNMPGHYIDSARLGWLAAKAGMQCSPLYLLDKQASFEELSDALKNQD